jgi:hypothetical protein
MPVRYRNGKKLMPELVRYPYKGTRSGTGMLRYQTGIQDAVGQLCYSIQTPQNHSPTKAKKREPSRFRIPREDIYTYPEIIMFCNPS